MEKFRFINYSYLNYTANCIPIFKLELTGENGGTFEMLINKVG